MKPYYGPDDHRFCAEETREDEPKRHTPVTNPSASEMALAGHEVLASARPGDWRYPERETTYNAVDEDGAYPTLNYTR